MKFLNVQNIVVLVLIALVAFLFLDKFKKGKIVYVNTAKVLVQYEGMKVAEKKFKDKAAQYKASLDTLYNELQGSMKEFERNRSRMTPREMKVSEELLQTKRDQFLAYQEATEKKAAEQENLIKEEALKRVNELILEYGKSKGYEFILGASAMGNIVYADETKDITEEVIQMLNQKYKDEHGQK